MFHTSICLLALLVAILPAAGGSTPALALDAPVQRPDPDAPATVPSTVSAVIQFDMTTLDRVLERMVPRRIATFRDRTRECWHRRVLGRDVHVDCEYDGYVERTGSLTLRAEGNRLSASVPLFGTVSARGTHGLLGLIHGNAEGAMSVYVSARPQLRRDWSVSLDMAKGFRWSEPPMLHVLGFSINVTRFVEPQIQRQLAGVQRTVAARVRELDIRGKAERVWQQMFTPVKLSDAPEIWLQMTPQSVAFAGIRAHGHVLEGAIEIKGLAHSTVGAASPAPDPTPLPRLGKDVSERGRFDVAVPVTVDYATIREKFREALAARAPGLDIPPLTDISVYPSDGRIVVAVTLGSGDGSRTIYLAARPRINADSGTIDFPDLAQVVQNAASAAAQGRNEGGGSVDPKLIDQLREDVNVIYQDAYQKLLDAANARLSRPLGEGFRSEGKLTSVSLDRVLLLAGGLRVDLRASGRMKVLYGP